MARYSRIVLSVIFSLCAGNLSAQWTNVAPHLVGPEAQRIGAVCFSDGTLWAGTTSLFYSKDTGKTWRRSNLSAFSGITDISFFDRSNGIVSTQGGIFLSNDAGATWTNISPAPGVTYVRSAFNGSPLTIHTLQYGTSLFSTSTDGGVNWSTVDLGSEGLSFGIAADKTVYVFSSDVSGGWVNSTSDLGVTWSANTNYIDGDSNSLSVDSCDNQRLYLVNENTVLRTNGVTNIDLSTNGGLTWTTPSSRALDYFSGSFASTTQVLYIGTVPNGGDGLLRSLDHGETWQNIGGPTENFDTRTIAAIDNNMIAVLDSAGSMWITRNSGGDSVRLGPSSKGAPQLVLDGNEHRFQATTCGPSQSVILLGVASCAPVNSMLDSISISGSTAFILRDVQTLPRSIGGSDSIFIQYKPTQGSGDTAFLHLTYRLSTARQDTIITLLGKTVSNRIGFDASQHPQYVSLSPGSFASLPLTVNVNPNINLDSIWPFLNGISANIQYDSTRLQFVSYTPSNGWTQIGPPQGQEGITLELKNVSSASKHPLDLGTAFSRWDHSTRGYVVRIPLAYLVLHTTSGDVPLCIQPSEDNIWTVAVQASSGVEEAKGFQNIRVYPNPVASELWVENTSEEPARVLLNDELGREIISATVQAGATAPLDMESATSSSYVLVIHQNNRTDVRRISKLR